jgi:hypothetical protein
MGVLCGSFNTDYFPWKIHKIIIIGADYSIIIIIQALTTSSAVILVLIPVLSEMREIIILLPLLLEMITLRLSVLSVLTIPENLYRYCINTVRPHIRHSLQEST